MSSKTNERGSIAARISIAAALALALVSAGCGAATNGSPAPSREAAQAPASPPAPSPAEGGAAAPGPTAPAPSVPGTLKNTLHWKTKWETLNKGFLVFRGDSEKGPFRQLTPQPLPGAGSANVAHEYSYEDTTIEAGREYFYYVVAINHNNEQVRVTPIQRAAPR